MHRALCLAGSFLLALSIQAQPTSSFVNFETAPVHPVALGPDGRTLAVCNLPDGRVELFDVASGVPQSIGDVPVGVDPVSVRWRSTNELWVANYISRSISIVDVARRLVVDTIATLDGPADIQFAGLPKRAFVSCAKENTVQVFDPITRQVITNLVIDGERPKAMALSPEGSKLYVAIFESGNGSTILVGTGTNTQNVLRHQNGPYGGQFPVPNDGNQLRPPLNTNASTEGWDLFLPDSLIVKKNNAGRWMDDNQGDWTDFVSGTNAGLSGRIPGWDLPDRDLAVIDTGTLDITYVASLMNLCMEVAVNPANGCITVVGTDGTNERRFEPNLQGTFLRVNLAQIEPGLLTPTILDLNPHLNYSTARVPQNVRDLSLGDPRGIVWNSGGTRGYVTGMGSRNLLVIDSNGQRTSPAPVELGEGPCGLALDEARQRLYVLNRFSASVSVVDTVSMTVVTNVPFFDPTPPATKIGRRHFYDTRRNSGLGHAACASCHPDGRFDRLAWDLGDPGANPSSFPGQGSGFHPMKGPMVTQTLQDIIEPRDLEAILPLHWRADRPNIEGFNVTFTDLLGSDARLTATAMQEFRDFLSTIHFPPSRYRNFDNSFPTNVPLPGLFGVDANGLPDRTPLPNGNAEAGRGLLASEFPGRFQLTAGTCVTCHNRDSGRGIEGDITLFEREDSRAFKAAQLRSIADKLGMDRQGTNSRAGFGFRFDGRADTLTSFFSDIFGVTNNQTIADLTAFLLAFPGSSLGLGFLEEVSQDAHAAVGRQLTLHAPGGHPLATQMIELARWDEQPWVGLVAHGVMNGTNRSWHFARINSRDLWRFQSDRNQEHVSVEELLALAGPETPLTLTVVPLRTGRRASIDRDGDGSFDRTEVDFGFDPANPLSIGNTPPRFQFPGPIAWTGYLFPGRPLPLAELLGVTDPDVPEQTLTFTLVGNVPPWVSLSSSNGVFSWMPPPEEGEFSAQYTLRVADDGVPPLSADFDFGLVYRPLRVLGLQRNHLTGFNQVEFQSVPGHSYRLQFKDRLENLYWSDLPGIVTASFEAMLLDFTATNTTQRFYRVVLVE